MATNYEIINLALGDEFSDRIPTATAENLANVAQAILNYAPAKNKFLDALFNKIGLTLINKVEFSNPFARFKGPAITYGDTIEDIYVDIIDGYAYDDTNTDPFGQSAPNVTAIYHTINSEMQYKVTIKDVLLRKAMRTPNGLSDLVTNIVGSLRDSADYDDYLMTMKVLSSDDIYGKIVYMGDATGTAETDGKTLLSHIKDMGSNLKHMSTEFNKMGTHQNTPMERQVLVISSQYKDIIDLDVLAGLYNLSKADISQMIIEVEGFIGNEGLVAVLVDERGFRLNQALADGGLIYNPQGLYTNHFYNNWNIISWALFRNAVAFKFAVEA